MPTLVVLHQMKALLAALSLAALALAGCASEDPVLHTCAKTGTVIDLATVEGSDAVGFDPESACPTPTPPSLAFKGLPTAFVAYKAVDVSWEVLNGSYLHGHAMATSIRLSHHSVPDADLVGQGPEAYGTELALREHQEVPQTFTAKLRFDEPRTAYLRLHGLIRGEGLSDTDFWSPEVAIPIEPVAPTGTTVTIVHGPGDFLAEVGTPTAKLGDELVFQNDDVVPHTFTWTKAPAGFPKVAVEVAAGAASGPILLRVPGTYAVQTNDVQPKTIEWSVPLP